MSDSPFYPSSLSQAIDGAISRVVHGIVTPGQLPEQELKVAIREFSEVRERTLELVSDVTPAQAAFKPKPKVWSVGENLDHLLLTEQNYRAQMRRLIDLARAGKGTSINLTLTEMNASIGPIPREVIPLFEMPLRMMSLFVPHAVREAIIRFPVIPSANPSISDPEQKDIGVLRKELVAELETTTAMFTGDMPPRLMEMTVSHPILGTNNVIRIFRLITAHEERHHGQMRTVMANPAWPRG
jgi:hypothetical protein